MTAAAQAARTTSAERNTAGLLSILPKGVPPELIGVIQDATHKTLNQHGLSAFEMSREAAIAQRFAVYSRVVDRGQGRGAISKRQANSNMETFRICSLLGPGGICDFSRTAPARSAAALKHR